MPQLGSLPAATKTRCNQMDKKIKIKKTVTPVIILVLNLREGDRETQTDKLTDKERQTDREVDTH